MIKLNRFYWIYVWILALILAIVLTWPLAAHISTYYLDASDHTYGGWTMWHIAEAIKSGSLFNMQQLFTGNQFYPHSYSFAYSDHMFVPGLLLFTPLYAITKHIVMSTNIIIIMSFVLTFVTSFATIRFFVKDTYASLIGAAIFTYNPFVFSHFPHHVNLLQRYFLPLVFLWGYRYVRIPTWRNAFVFYAVFTLNWLTAIYFGIFVLVFLPIFCLPIFLNSLKKGMPYLKKLLFTSIVLILYVPLLYFVTKPYLVLSSRETVTRSLNDAVHFSARGIDWFSPDPRNLLYVQDRQHVNDHRFPKEITGFNYSEHTLFLNIIPPLLFLFGLLFTLKIQKNTLSKSTFIAFGLVLILSALLTFGPIYTGWNEPPKTASQPLLYYYAYNILYPLQAMRVPTRFQFIFYIPFSLICAYGMLFIKKHCNKNSYYIFATGMFVFLIIIENLTIIPYTEQSYRSTQIKNYLKTNPQIFNKLINAPTLHLPMYTKDVQYKELGYVNWALYTHEKTVNGYSAYVPLEYQDILKQSKTITDSFIRYLGHIGVRYVVVHLDALTAKEHQETLNNVYVKKLTIFKDANTVILSTARESSVSPVCINPNPTIALEFPKQVPQLTLLPYTLTITNKSQCVIQNLYENRYLPIRIQVGDTKIATTIIVPFAIEPNKSATMSGTLKQKPSYIHLSPGKHAGAATISRYNKVIDFVILAY